MSHVTAAIKLVDPRIARVVDLVPALLIAGMPVTLPTVVMIVVMENMVVARHLVAVVAVMSVIAAAAAEEAPTTASALLQIAEVPARAMMYRLTRVISGLIMIQNCPVVTSKCSAGPSSSVG